MKTKNLIKIAAIIALCAHGCKVSKDYREYYNRGIARLGEGGPTFIGDARTSVKENMTRPSQT
jgi:hypothetical protein